MDPKIIVVVMGLAAFVVNKDEGFYVMIPNEAVVTEVVHPHSTHKAMIYSWDEGKDKLKASELPPTFAITLPGDQSFDPKDALILASSASPFRTYCSPGEDLAKCTFKVGGNALPLVSSLGTIGGGRGSMAAFDSDGKVVDWYRTKKGRLCGFVNPDLAPSTYLDKVTNKDVVSAMLNDVFVVESDPVAISDRPPKLMLGASPLALGLAPAKECKRWTRREEECYPLLITNAPPPIKFKPPMLPAHIHLALVDYDVNVIYELLKANDPRPLPIEVAGKPPTGSPYKCRTGAVVIK